MNNNSSSSSTSSANSSSFVDNDASGRVRKGRNSVEEIICEAVRGQLGIGSRGSNSSSSNSSSSSVYSGTVGVNSSNTNNGNNSNDGNDIVVSVGGDVMRVKMHSCGREDIDVRMLGEYTYIYNMYTLIIYTFICIL